MDIPIVRGVLYAGTCLGKTKFINDVSQFRLNRVTVTLMDQFHFGRVSITVIKEFHEGAGQYSQLK